MKLSNYINSNDLTQAYFAAKICVSQTAIHRYLNGRIPEPEVMIRIINETDGQVTANDFYDIGDTPAESKPKHTSPNGEEYAKV